MTLATITLQHRGRGWTLEIKRYGDGEITWSAYREGTRVRGDDVPSAVSWAGHAACEGVKAGMTAAGVES